MFDNYDMWEFNEAKKEDWLESRPVCEHCGHPIQDESLFDIEGTLYHAACACEKYCAETEDYVR